jgi:predicted TIM-barrel fold metal-dependent hydrolase
MRTITLEEHFATPRFLDGPGRDLKEQAEKFNNARALKLIPQLCDLGDKRIAEMDAAGIDMQIVSLTAPGVEQLEAAEAISLAAETNDFVADAIEKHPSRFGGFAALPTASPDKAAQELERRVRGQKFALSTATTAAAISTIDFSGRSWKVPNSSARRSTYIQRGHRNRS